MLSRGYGLNLHAWQCDILESWLSIDKYDRWSASRCGLLIPRQNGKTGLLNMRELYGLVVLGERIVHTAHQQKTATEAFRDLKQIFRHKDLTKLLDGDPLSALGREEIRLKNGGVIKYIARTRASGLGFTADVLVLDEAQELIEAKIEALMPTISAAPSGNPQTIMVGAAPGIDSPGEVFRRLRKDGITGKDKRLSWHEWSVEAIGEVADRSRWEDTNPSLGLQLKGTTIDAELKTLSDDSFARQRLCWWPDKSAEQLIDKASWDKLATEKPAREGKQAFAVRFSPDGELVCVAAALKPIDDKMPHIEVVLHRSTHNGVQWLVEWLQARWQKTALIVVDGKAGAQALIEKLRAAGVGKKAICEPRVADVIASTSRLLSAVNEEAITHFDQPMLNEAALNAKKRPIGKEGYGFGGIDACDVTPIEACTLALWAVMTTKRDPRRKMRIG
jgi:phage terminase large subunit-like protein